MKFNPNKTPVEVIKEEAFGGTYFRDIYWGVNRKWYRNSSKDFNELKNIDQKFYCSDYYDVKLNTCKVKTGTSLRFWESKGWINEIDSYGWFQQYFRYILGRKFSDDFRQIIRRKKIVSRIKGKLVKWLKILGVNLMIIQFHLK